MTTKKKTQRDLMRELYSLHSTNEERVISEYAGAELRGEVERRSNMYAIDAKEYARRLLEDGKRKGWLED